MNMLDPNIRTLLSGHSVPVPFVCNQADASIVLGDVDLGVATKLVAEEGLAPIRTSAERGVGGVWLMNYASTCLGPYREIVLTVMTAGEPITIDDDPYAMGALVLDARVRVFVASLLLPRKEQVAIDYGRELLHFDKRPVEAIDIDATEPGATKWRVREGERELLTARIADSGFGASLTGALALIRHAGFGRTLAARKGIAVQGAAPLAMGGGIIDTQLFGTGVLRPFGEQDNLQFAPNGPPVVKQLDRFGFRPRLVNRMKELRFTMQLRG